MKKLSLSKYTRRTLSDVLQIAQQADNAGVPLPCWLVEQIVEAHDNLLPVEQQVGDYNAPAQGKKHPKAKIRKPIKVGAIDGTSCNRHGTRLYRAECGKQFCPDCLDEGY